MAITSDAEALKTIDKLVLEIKLLCAALVVIVFTVTWVSIEVSVRHCDAKDPKPDLVEVSKSIEVGDMVTHRMDGWDGMVIGRDGSNMEVRICIDQVRRWGIAPIFSGLAIEWDKDD